jgi:hypothetical protein
VTLAVIPSLDAHPAHAKYRFSLTLTSVTQASTDDTTTAYYVHGSLEAECVGGPSESAPPPAGNVGVTITF